MSFKFSAKKMKKGFFLRTVLTIVIAHMFFASRNTQDSYGDACNAKIFLRGLKLCRENRTKQVLLISKKKIGATMHFSEIIKLQFGKEHHTFHRTLNLFFSNIVD